MTTHDPRANVENAAKRIERAELRYFARVVAQAKCPGQTECSERFRCDGCRARLYLNRYPND